MTKTLNFTRRSTVSIGFHFSPFIHRSTLSHRPCIVFNASDEDDEDEEEEEWEEEDDEDWDEDEEDDVEDAE